MNLATAPATACGGTPLTHPIQRRAPGASTPSITGAVWGRRICYAGMDRQIQQSPSARTDREHPRQKPRPTSKRLWNMNPGPRNPARLSPPSMVYFYARRRAGENAEAFLSDFEEILKADILAAMRRPALTCGRRAIGVGTFGACRKQIQRDLAAMAPRSSRWSVPPNSMPLTPRSGTTGPHPERADQRALHYPINLRTSREPPLAPRELWSFISAATGLHRMPQATPRCNHPA